MSVFDTLTIAGPIVYSRNPVSVSAGSGSYSISVDRVDARGLISRTGRWRLTITQALYSSLPRREFAATYHADADAALAHAWQIITDQ